MARQRIDVARAKELRKMDPSLTWDDIAFLLSSEAERKGPGFQGQSVADAVRRSERAQRPDPTP